MGRRLLPLLRAGGPSLLEHLSKAVKAKMVIILPFPVLIGRGDLQHAGAGDIDYPGFPVRGCLRYHMNFVPHEKNLLDGVHFATGLTPDFAEPEEEEQRRTAQQEAVDDSSSSGDNDEEESGESAESSDVERK